MTTVPARSYPGMISFEGFSANMTSGNNCDQVSSRAQSAVVSTLIRCSFFLASGIGRGYDDSSVNFIVAGLKISALAVPSSFFSVLKVDMIDDNRRLFGKC